MKEMPFFISILQGRISMVSWMYIVSLSRKFPWICPTKKK